MNSWIIRIVCAAVICVAVMVVAVKVRTPMGLAMWMVEKYPTYFLTPDLEWQKENSFFDKWVPRLLAYKLFKDWLSYEYIRSGLSKDSSIQEAAYVLEAQLKPHLTTQKDVGSRPFYLPPYPRLIHGFSWCDGVNFIYAALITEVYGKQILWALRNEKGVSSHTLVKTEVENFTVYLDYWNPTATIYRIEANVPKQYRDIPLFDEYFEQGKIPVPKQDHLKGNVFLEVHPSKVRFGTIQFDFLDQYTFTKPEGPHAGFKKYLKARIYQSYGYTGKAVELYKQLPEECPGQIYCKISKHLIQRVTDKI